MSNSTGDVRHKLESAEDDDDDDEEEEDTQSIVTIACAIKSEKDEDQRDVKCQVDADELVLCAVKLLPEGELRNNDDDDKIEIELKSVEQEESISNNQDNQEARMYATRSSPSTSFRYCYTTSASAADEPDCYTLPPTQLPPASGRGFSDEPTKLSFASQRMKEYFETFKSRGSTTGSGRLYQFFKSTRTELIACLLFTVILSHSLISCRTHLQFDDDDDAIAGSPSAKNKLLVHLLGGGLVSSFTVATLTQVFGHISGCHLAPAVSLALYFKGHISRARLASYLGAQTLGSLVGVALLGLLTSSQIGAGGLGVNYQQLALSDAYATLAHRMPDNDAMSGAGNSDNRLKMTTASGGGVGGTSTSNLRAPQISTLATSTTQSDDLFELKSKAARRRRRRRSLSLSEQPQEYQHNDYLGDSLNSTQQDEERSETILLSIEEQKGRELEAKLSRQSAAAAVATSKEQHHISQQSTNQSSKGFTAYATAEPPPPGTSAHSDSPDGDIARIKVLAASNVTSNSLESDANKTTSRHEFQFSATPAAEVTLRNDDNASAQARPAAQVRLAMVPLTVDLRPTSGGELLIETTTPAHNNNEIKLPPASMTTTTTSASRLLEPVTQPTTTISSLQVTKIVKRKRRTHSRRSFPPNTTTNSSETHNSNNNSSTSTSTSTSNNSATGSAESTLEHSNLLAFALPDSIMSSDSIRKCLAEKYLQQMELNKRNFRLRNDQLDESGSSRDEQQRAFKRVELQHCLGLSNGSQMFIFQLIGTLLIVLTYLTNVDPRRTDLGFKSLSIGLAYFLAHLLTLTSGGFYPNPAQLLALFWFQSSAQNGPSATNWQPEWFIYLVTPLIGGLFGALSHEYIDFTSLRNRTKQLHLRRSFYSLDNLTGCNRAAHAIEQVTPLDKPINSHNYQHRHRSVESSQASSLEPASSSFTIQDQVANCNTNEMASNSLGARSSLLALHAIESATANINHSEQNASGSYSRQLKLEQRQLRQSVASSQQLDSNFLIAASSTATASSCPQVAGSARRYRNSPTSSTNSARRPVYVHERAGIF